MSMNCKLQYIDLYSILGSKDVLSSDAWITIFATIIVSDTFSTGSRSVNFKSKIHTYELTKQLFYSSLISILSKKRLKMNLIYHVILDTGDKYERY